MPRRRVRAPGMTDEWKAPDVCKLASLVPVTQQLAEDAMWISAAWNGPKTEEERAERDRLREERRQVRLAEARAKFAEQPRLTPEQMVRQLADTDPRDGETGDCTLCGGWSEYDGTQEERQILSHAPKCGWLQAVTWCEE